MEDINWNALILQVKQILGKIKDNSKEVGESFKSYIKENIKDNDWTCEPFVVEIKSNYKAVKDYINELLYPNHLKSTFVDDFLEFVTCVMNVFGNIINFCPIIGHIKGILYHFFGYKTNGTKALIGASRTTFVFYNPRIIFKSPFLSGISIGIVCLVADVIGIAYDIIVYFLGFERYHSILSAYIGFFESPTWTAAALICIKHLFDGFCGCVISRDENTKKDENYIVRPSTNYYNTVKSRQSVDYNYRSYDYPSNDYSTNNFKAQINDFYGKRSTFNDYYKEPLYYDTRHPIIKPNTLPSVTRSNKSEVSIASFNNQFKVSVSQPSVPSILRISDKSELVHLKMPNHLDHTGGIRSNNAFEGLLHSFLRHSDQWQQYLGVIAQINEMPEFKKSLKAIGAADTKDRRELLHLFMKRKGNLLHHKDLKILLNDTQNRMYRFLQENIKYYTFISSNNSEQRYNCYFRVTDLSGNAQVMLIGMTQKLTSTKLGNCDGDSRPVRRIITIYFLPFNQYNKLKY